MGDNSLFAEYHNRHYSKSGILFGSGPSVRDFACDSNVVRFGMNEQIYLDLDLDYWFMGDTMPAYPGRFLECRGDYEEYHPRIQKFIRHQLWSSEGAMPLGMKHAKYYLCDQGEISNDVCEFKKDISVGHLRAKRSITFEALQFVLYSGIKKLYLVGHDCRYDSGTFRTEYDQSICRSYETKIVRYWMSCKEWIASEYSDVRIYSINPVGLTGVFERVAVCDIISNENSVE